MNVLEKKPQEYCRRCRNLCDKVASCHCSNFKDVCEKCMFKHNSARKRSKLMFERGRDHYNRIDPTYNYHVIEAGTDRRGNPRKFIKRTTKDGKEVNFINRRH